MFATQLEKFHTDDVICPGIGTLFFDWLLDINMNWLYTEAEGHMLFTEEPLDLNNIDPEVEVYIMIGEVHECIVC